MNICINKRLIILTIILFVIYMLVGCGERFEKSENIIETIKFIEILNSEMKLYVDTETGVEYIRYYKNEVRLSAGGLTPRYNRDGTLKINKEYK